MKMKDGKQSVCIIGQVQWRNSTNRKFCNFGTQSLAGERVMFIRNTEYVYTVPSIYYLLVVV